MSTAKNPGYAAFEGDRLIAAGDLPHVALAARQAMGRGGPEPLLIFDDTTGRQVELDLRGSDDDVVSRLPQNVAEETPAVAPRRPGRPKLGVVGREVTLLPRHWEWLNSQPGGASVALRKLVEEARRSRRGVDRVRQSQEAAYRFLTVLAGNLPGYEEATRALFSADAERFDEYARAWPAGVRDYATKLAAAAFEGE